MINQCYDCVFACEYLLPYWFPYFDPTCCLGNPMHIKKECFDFKRIGRESR